jgi:hypothetical protein
VIVPAIAAVEHKPVKMAAESIDLSFIMIPYNKIEAMIYPISLLTLPLNSNKIYSDHKGLYTVRFFQGVKKVPIDKIICRIIINNLSNEI